MAEEIQKVFSEEFLVELFKSKTPAKQLAPVVVENFKFLGPLITEEDSKATLILCNFFLDTFTVLKQKHSLTMLQCGLVMDVFMQLINYSVKVSQFSKEQDLEYLQKLVVPCSQGMYPLMTKQQVNRSLEQLNLSYFNHYLLYKFLFTEERTQENVTRLLDIDLPLPIAPHNASTQRVHKPPEEVLQEPEPVKEVEEVPVKETLKERLLKNLDESLREKFLEKVSEAREAMTKQLEQRDKMLKQKWEDLEKELKRKRRRN